MGKEFERCLAIRLHMIICQLEGGLAACMRVIHETCCLSSVLRCGRDSIEHRQPVSIVPQHNFHTVAPNMIARSNAVLQYKQKVTGNSGQTGELWLLSVLHAVCAACCTAILLHFAKGHPDNIFTLFCMTNGYQCASGRAVFHHFSSSSNLCYCVGKLNSVAIHYITASLWAHRKHLCICRCFCLYPS